ncbi:MAG: phospholipase D-like domain-containing protein [Gemmatimonadota bacterium]
MALLLLLILLGIVGGITVQFFMRGAAIRRIETLDERDGALEAGSDHFCLTFERLTDTRLSPDNEIEILTNGDGTFPRLLEDLRSARRLITWQVYWFKPGRLAERVREVLEERARAGVRVYCLFDYFGSHGLPAAYRDSLREAGVHVGTFRPLEWKSLYKVQQRSHVRSVVIDGRIGYTGGFGIDDNWSGGGRRPGEWRDTNVRLVGMTVDQLQAAFVVNWAESSGELLVGDPLFAVDREDRRGNRDAGIVYTDPGLGSTRAERLFVLSIAAARRRLYITSAYFIPTRGLRRLLVDAVARGVDVRVLNPGANTDQVVTWYAARAHYRELIEGGVRIYEYEPTMIHAKTLVVDEIWCALGTINFDNRSIVLNDEAVLLARDREVGTKLHDLFLEDLQYAREVSLEAFGARGWGSKLKERAARTISPFL